MKLIIGLTTLLILLGCESKKVTYSLLFADNASIVMDTQEIPETNFNGLNESGTWSHELNQVVYSKGTWENGLKKGIWKYNTGEREFDITYAYYKDAVSNFQISYPTNWKIYEKLNPSSLFSVSDTTENGDRRTKLFIVLAHDKVKIDKTLKTFNDYLNESMLTDSILAKKSYKIIGAKREYYLNVYRIKKYGEELLTFNLLGDSDFIIYDISYKTLNINSEEKLLRFLEMSLTARLNCYRFLDPLDKIERIESVD
jgi:hypothetical protein